MSMNAMGGLNEIRMRRPGQCHHRHHQQGPNSTRPGSQGNPKGFPPGQGPGPGNGPASTRPGSEGNPRGFKPGEGPGPGNGPIAAGGKVEGSDHGGGVFRGGRCEVPQDGGYRPSLERMGGHGISSNVGELLKSLQGN